MSDHHCPDCHHPNPSGSKRCQNCGALLPSRAIVITQRSPLSLSRPQWPATPIKTIGASVALSAIVLLADAGLRYLRSRVSLERALLPAPRRRPPTVVSEVRIEEKKPDGRRVVTIFSERIIEERRWGRPVRRIVDRLAWRSEESLSP